MKQSLKRTILASLLLALYAFVALPASLWHHHHCSHISFNNKQAKETLSPLGKTISQAGCDVCNHQYSVYTPSETISIQPTITAVGMQFASIDSKLKEALVFKASNKGPPSVG